MKPECAVWIDTNKTEGIEISYAHIDGSRPPYYCEICDVWIGDGTPHPPELMGEAVEHEEGTVMDFIAALGREEEQR